MVLDPNELTIDDLVDYAPPQCYEDELPLSWQMTRAERFVLMHLLRVSKPELSLEVGTYKGGSLQALSHYSKEVISIDVANVASNLAGYFRNVTFKSGDSKELLPEVVREINSSHRKAGLVLIDGDHSEEGVRRDATAVLQLEPRRSVFIVMHDSFHPPCRAGMRAVPWAGSPYVHYVELDFVGGIVLPGRLSVEQSMYGGFGVAMMLPQKRDFELNIFESQVQQFDVIRSSAPSASMLIPRLMSRVRGVARRLISKTGL